MRKNVLAILVLFSVDVGICLLAQGASTASSNILSNENQTTRFKENELSASTPWTKEGLKKTGEILEKIRKQGDSGFLSVVHEPGMLPRSMAVEIAKIKVDSFNYDRGKEPKVLLVDGCCVVQFYDFQNIYYAKKRTISCSVVIDVWTGKAIGMQHARRGPSYHILDPKTPGETEEEKLANKIRMRDSGLELSIRMRHGQPLSSERQSGMILPDAAIRIARQYAISRNRTFDTSRKPQAVLIDDIYFIVFWRSPNLVSERGPTYDSRVGVDAFTGEVIAMEITRYSKNEPLR